MYSGVFTANEAAGVGTFALFILFLISKKLSRQAWPLVMASLRDSLSTTAMILLILVSAQVFSRLLVLSGIGRMMTSFIGHAGLTPLQFVIAATLLYLVLGCFIDSISILAITIPIFQPVVLSMGIDPIWFAMTMIVATQIGTITPPMGLCVYAVKGVAGPTVSLEEVFRGSLPFFFFMLIAQVIIIAFPMISTWIPYNLWK
jgi:TRAP-type C4-dicarboxylate transport system permease large subunit